MSRQLGHSDVSITARHYARWAGGDAYRSPLEVSEDEVPADLLARFAAKSPQIPHSAAHARMHEPPGTVKFRGLGSVAGARSDRLHTVLRRLVVRMRFKE